MNYGIVSNKTRDINYEIAIRVAKLIIDHGHTPVFEKSLSSVLKGAPEGTVFKDFDSIELKTIISVGGDGTFLSVVAGYRSFGHGVYRN